MPCLDENMIIAFFAEAPESGLAASVHAHAADCKACRDVLAAYAALGADGSRVGRASFGLTEASRAANAPSPMASFDPLARALAKAHASKRLGQTVGDRWRLDSLLGMGGMAIVFAATHRNGKRVAIKMMRPELAIEPSLVQRFLREAYTANRVGHAGALAVNDDARTDDGVPFLVMELLEGRTLRERLLASGPLRPDDARHVAIAVLDILASAHEKGIVHRDVKPENLFETTSGVLYVLDFGIARLMDSTEAQALTHSGVTMGTLGFMPPEQARGNASQVDARSDLWAVGATLFTLLTGRAVHAAPTHNEGLLLAMTAKVARVRVLVPELPASLATVLDKALAFEKDARWESARAMQAALAQAKTDAHPANARRASRTQTQKRMRGGALVATAAAGALMAFALTRGSSGAPTPTAALVLADAQPISPPRVERLAVASAPPPPSSATPPSPPARAPSPKPSSTRVITSASSAHSVGPTAVAPAPVSTPAPAPPPTSSATIDPLGPRT